VEVFGSADPMLDVEVIQLNLELLKEIGLDELALNLNSVGCPECRLEFIKLLKKYFKPLAGKMCADCRERYKVNTLRILDCKEEKCQKVIDEAPTAGETLCQNCRTHFNQVIRILGDLGIRYKTNKRLVRGLDYYTKTAFEIVSEKLGAQNAVSGGGRYDNLVQELGGKATPAVGFAIGLERVVGLMTNDELRMPNEGKLTLLIATMGEEAKKVGFELISWARAKGLSADMDYLGRSLKAQLKAADKAGAKNVFIIGEEELKKRAGQLKDMASGQQREVAFDKLFEAL
jgi:histidyl-tRNA synthetase